MIIVTGGAGFIGSNIIAASICRGEIFQLKNPQVNGLFNVGSGKARSAEKTSMSEDGRG